MEPASRLFPPISEGADTGVGSGGTPTNTMAAWGRSIPRYAL